MQTWGISNWWGSDWPLAASDPIQAGARPGAELRSTMDSSATIEPTDADLFARIREGDSEAFATFYDRHASLLFGVACKILGPGHDAEDVLQDAAVQIWERAPLYDAGLGQPVSWAVALTRNKAIDRLRSLRRRSELAAEVALEPVSETSREPGAWHHLAAEEDSKSVHLALVTLPLEQRQAIELAFFKGLTQQEVAAQLGQPLGTIKARIRRGMLALRDFLEDHT